MIVANKFSAVERRAKILSQIEDTGQVNVQYLSKLFGVSEVTIRNDLARLEQKNVLFRTRGGAIRQTPVATDFSFSEKAMKHHAEKKRIGAKAAGQVKEGDTIILDSGTTTHELARHLTRFKSLTVITAALNIAGQLADAPGVKVVMPGGILRKSSFSLVGPPAEKMLREYFCDRAFLGVDGISPEYGISTPIVEEAHLNRAMIECSKQVVVVTDSSKFGRRSFAHIAPLSKIDIVITDSNISDEYKDLLESKGIEVIVA